MSDAPEPIPEPGPIDETETETESSTFSFFSPFVVIPLFILLLIVIYIVSRPKKSHRSLSCDTSSTSSDAVRDEPQSPGSISSIKRIMARIRDPSRVEQQ